MHTKIHHHDMLDVNVLYPLKKIQLFCHKTFPKTWARNTYLMYVAFSNFHFVLVLWHNLSNITIMYYSQYEPSNNLFVTMQLNWSTYLVVFVVELLLVDVLGFLVAIWSPWLISAPLGDIEKALKRYISLEWICRGLYPVFIPSSGKLWYLRSLFCRIS